MFIVLKQSSQIGSCILLVSARPLTKFGHFTAQRIKENGVPILSDYNLFLLMRRAYKDAKKVYLRKPYLTLDDYRRFRKQLLDHEFITRDRDFHNAFDVVDLPTPSPEEICCLVHPSVYISHLSAMQRYGLTDRRPVALLLTAPAPSVARELLEVRFLEDYGKDTSLARDEILVPSTPRIPEQVRGRPIETHTTKYFGESLKLRGTFARIATIGQTFLDTLTAPSLCGGMSHVLDIWHEQATLYLDDIIQAVDRTPYKIVRARAGYILEERLRIQDTRIMKWLDDAERGVQGGTRLLDPSKPFADTYSERWMISINVN